MPSSNDEHEFQGLNLSLASPRFGPLSDERIPVMEGRGLEKSLSVLICVHLWLY